MLVIFGIHKYLLDGYKSTNTRYNSGQQDNC